MKKYVPYIPVFFMINIYMEFQKLGFPQKELRSEADYTSFVGFTEKIALTMGVFLFLSLALAPAELKKSGIPSSRTWFKGIFTILIPFTILVLVFNPLGTFPWRTDNASLNARIRKPLIYAQLKTVPDIIFLGTSNSFRIPAKKSPSPAFNFSVEAANPVDFFTLANSFLAQAGYDGKPAVIVTEIYSPGLSTKVTESWKQYSLEYIKYMPLIYARETINSQFSRTFSLESLSTILFTEYFSWNDQWSPEHEFAEDGSILPYEIGGSYEQRVAESTPNLDDLLRCNNLDPQGIELILKMVTLSRQQKAGLVFYRTPINRDFYTSDGMLFRYKPCSKRIDKFLTRLQQENENVFYVDLSDYSLISSGGSTMFIDTHHLTDAGSETLLQALTPTIMDALLWAESQRELKE